MHRRGRPGAETLRAPRCSGDVARRCRGGRCTRRRQKRTVGPCRLDRARRPRVPVLVVCAAVPSPGTRAEVPAPVAINVALLLRIDRSVRSCDRNRRTLNHPARFEGNQHRPDQPPTRPSHAFGEGVLGELPDNVERVGRPHRLRHSPCRLVSSGPPCRAAPSRTVPSAGSPEARNTRVRYQTFNVWLEPSPEKKAYTDVLIGVDSPLWRE